jgi:SAM-dependent methyltransferase
MAESTGAGALGARCAEHKRGAAEASSGGRERVDGLRAAISDVPSAWVLNLGCRDGSLALELGLHPGRTVCVEIDPDAPAVAATSGSLSACRIDLWRALPFADGSFDRVLAGEIVEHVSFPTDLVAEVARVLTPGGKFIRFGSERLPAQESDCLRRRRWFEADLTHLRDFSPSMLRTFLSPDFAEISIVPCVGRFARLWPRMLANDVVWSAFRKNGSPMIDGGRGFQDRRCRRRGVRLPSSDIGRITAGERRT